MKTLGKLKLKEEKMLNHEELLGFRGGSGGGTGECAGYGVDKCNDKCPCTSASDWCVNGKCDERPI